MAKRYKVIDIRATGTMDDHGNVVCWSAEFIVDGEARFDGCVFGVQGGPAVAVARLFEILRDMGTSQELAKVMRDVDISV
jgi:hypothetical protein